MGGVAGTWKLTLSALIGSQQATLVLDVDGRRVTGTASSDAGAIQLGEGTLDGERVTIPIELTHPRRISATAKLTVSGDTIKGRITGAPLPVRVSGTRVR